VTALQNLVLATARQKLEATGLFARVGSFPDDAEKLGARLPAALLADGDQLDYRALPGRRVQYLYHLYVWVYHHAPTNRAQSLNLLTDAILGALLDPTGYSANVTNIEAVAVEKGEAAAAAPDFHAPGAYANLTVQRVTLTMLLTDTRS